MVGADAVVVARRHNPAAPVVALVDDRSPTESVLAQLAGADVVLSVDRPDRGEPGLELAIRAAAVISARRNELGATSRQASHDTAEALNVIGLVAEAAEQGRVDADAGFAQIRDLVGTAGDEAWRAGRTHRGSGLVVACIELNRLFDGAELPGDINVEIGQPETLVFVDPDWFRDALGEVVATTRHNGAVNVEVRVTAVAGENLVEVRVRGVDGSGMGVELGSVDRPFPAPPGSSPSQTRRLGMRLASIAERAGELGGRLEVIDPGFDSSPPDVALFLPSVEPQVFAPKVESPELDPAAAQANILEGVVRHAPLAESLEGIVAAIENQLPGTVCSVLLLQDQCLRHGAGAQLPQAYRDAIDGVEIGLGQGSCGTAAHTGRPVIASDVNTDRNWTDFRAIASQHGLRSCWSTPIVAAADGETLGTFAVYTYTVWSPDEAAISLVNRYTYLAAVAIEHHRLFGALAESEARFRSAFEGAAAGIALTTLDGVVLKSNPALEALLGPNAGQLDRSSFLDLIDPQFRDLVLESWELLSNGERSRDVDPVEVPLAHPSGGARTWLSLHTSIVPGDSGQRPYLYVEMRDVTRVRQQLADTRAREAAEAANRAKTDVLALASHELRTPLNAILGFAQVMQLVEMDQEQRTGSVDQIVRAGRHLRDLIDQLLDLSRIESGQLTATNRPVDAGQLIDEALELVRPLAVARGIELLNAASDDRTQNVLADPRCMRQVLINLVDNAVKYTHGEGSVEVSMATVDSSMLRVTVTDSGSGISDDSLEVIFEPFHRLDREAESEGSGLGLALCARLMQEMDGTIGVTSTVGVGSSFWIELPAAPATLDTEVDPEISDHPKGLANERSVPDASGSTPGVPGTRAPTTVLYVEDDPACVEVMRAALHLRPMITLCSVPSAAEAASKIATETPALVLLDIGLPDRSGWDLLRELQASHPRLPVMVLTAGDDTVPTTCAEPDGVFAKPIDVGEVLGAIDSACFGVAMGNGLTQPVDV